MDKERLKKGIFEKIKEFYNLEHRNRRFVPGSSKIHFAGRVYDEKEMIAMVDSVLDFWLTLGEQNEKFERGFSEFLNSKHIILANSGSSANLLAVSALKSPQLEKRLKSGDEVITPAATFPTTFSPIIQNNLVPVLIDVEPGTYNIDAGKLKDALTENTRLLVIPHTLGNANEMDVIMEFAEEHGLFVVEDSCDALDSKYNGKKLGTFGDMGTFSFYPAHHITMGEGGAVVTDDAKLDMILRSIRDWGRTCTTTCDKCEFSDKSTGYCRMRFSTAFEGMPKDYDRRYVYTNIGYNLKPTDIQAAMGVEQLKKLEAFSRARNKNFRVLYEEFSRYEDCFILPRSLPKAEPCWFAFPLTVRDNAPFKRRDIVAWLERNKIETRLLFAGNITRQPAYRGTEYKIKGGLRNTDKIMRDSFFIGVYPGIGAEEINYMLEKIREFMNKFAR